MIIPAHNEAKRLPATLDSINDYMYGQPYNFEIIVVENGSEDNTAEVVEANSVDNDHINLIKVPERGKGIAVRTGMLAANGEYRFMCDADLSMPIEQIERFLPPATSNYDIAMGSREIAGSIRFHEPAFTHVRGRIFSNLVKLMVLPGFEDTQCGFKCFHASAAIDLFTSQLLDGMSFDVEVLYIARKRGYKIVEVPVDWYFHRETRVRMVEDSLRMLVDILVLRKNWKSGKYDRKI
ncbi:MAG: glycosyl transferase [Chloroflexi bacterium]|nr:glycosyl transferase [Chloroflexota bacterium]MBS59881.1 glycosyl transferase [Anaerolineaceae bacterium]HCU79770.1 glycosyl transferase [Chloroflexota bacterium]